MKKIIEILTCSKIKLMDLN